MNNDQKRTLSLEKTLLRYNDALENGDFETVAKILLEAETDAQLEQMIIEINDFHAAEIEEIALEQDAVQIRELIQSQLLSALPGAAPEPPPLTVGNVIARIHADAALRGQIDREALAATRGLQAAETPLPDVLSLSGVSKLLQELGIEVGRRFQTLFRDTALYMRMGRNQGMARMAATRRQQEARRGREAYRGQDAHSGPHFGLSESKATYAASEAPPQPPNADAKAAPTDKPATNESSTDEQATNKPATDTGTDE